MAYVAPELTRPKTIARVNKLEIAAITGIRIVKPVLPNAFFRHPFGTNIASINHRRK